MLELAMAGILTGLVGTVTIAGPILKKKYLPKR